MLKKITVFLFILSLTVKAQESKPPNSIYIVVTRDTGNYISGGSIDLNYVNKENLSFSIGVMGNSYFNKNYPTDNWNAIGEQSSAAHLYLTVGKIIKIKNSHLFRFNLSGGLAMSYYNIVKNYVRGDEYSDGSYFYDYDDKLYRNMSVIISPKLEITIFSWGGFQISPKVVLNNRKSFYGVGLGLMFGK